MENIKKHLEQAEKKLNTEWQEKEKLILDDIERAKREIADLAKNGGFSKYAIIDFENETLEDVNETQNLPELVRIGKLIPAENLPLTDIPMLLPFSDSAISFDLNEKDKSNVHALFELIAFRFMLSLPLNLSKFYFVDNNLGRDFALVNKIDKNIVNYKIIANQQDMGKIFSDLEQIVGDAYKKHLATFNSLKEYNKTAGEMQEAYHFVFITNFPAGFTTETAEKLLKFIENGNAAKAGVFIFFSIDRNEKMPYGIDLEQFLKSTTRINQNSNFQQNSKINDIFDW